MARDNPDPASPNVTGPGVPGGGPTDAGYYPGDVGGAHYGTPGGNGGGGGGQGGGNQAAAVTGNGFDPQNLLLGTDGQIYAYKRTFNGTSYGWETVPVGAADDPNAISAATGIPIGALGPLIQEAKNTAAKVQAGSYGKILGVGADGTVIVTNPQGKIERVTAAQAQAMGIQPEEIMRAQAELGQTQKTLTKMGQYTVRGINPDGSVSVEDFDGNLHTYSAADAAYGRIRGVSFSDWQRAIAEYTQNERTLGESQNYTILGTAPDGTVTVKDYYGKTTAIKPDASGNLIDTATGQPVKGIAASQIQDALQRQNELTFNGQTVGQTLGFPLPGGASPPGGPPPPSAGGVPPTGNWSPDSAHTPGVSDPGAPPGSPPPTENWSPGSGVHPAYANVPTGNWSPGSARTPADAAQGAPAAATSQYPQYPQYPSGYGSAPTLPSAPPAAPPPAQGAPAASPPPAPAPLPATSAPPPMPGALPTGTPAGGSAQSATASSPGAALNARYQAAATQYNGAQRADDAATPATPSLAPGSARTPGAPSEGVPGTTGNLAPGSARTPAYPGAPPAYPGGINDWTNQTLRQRTEAMQNYLNYGRAAQQQQTQALAGQSRSGQGTGFSSIGQRQIMAGQQG